MRTAYVLTAFLLLCSAGLGQTTSSDSSDSGGYTGPAVLSRAGRPIGRYLGAPLSFRFFATTAGHYSTDLTPVNLANGQVGRTDAYGGSVGAGIYGVRQGAHDSLGVDLHGNYNVYAGANHGQYDGANVRVGVNYARQTSARTAFELSASSGTYTNFSGLHQIVTTDPFPNLTDPTAETFNNRNSYYTGRAGFSYSASRRWSVAFSGGGSYYNRQSSALLDSKGLVASSSLMYSVSQRTGVGVSYGFARFTVSRDAGTTRSHSVALVLNRQIGPGWSASLSAGVYRADSNRLVAVALDPVLEALLGPQRVLEPTSQVNWGPAISASLNHVMRRSSASIYYSHGVSQGNSFIAIAASDSLGAHYSYTATSRLNVGLNARYLRHSGITQQGIRYESYGGGLGLNYRLISFIHFSAGVDYYRGAAGATNFSRDRVNVSVGLSFSPGELPLSLF